jgi:hypothetical protein
VIVIYAVRRVDYAMFGYGEQELLQGALPWLDFQLIQDYFRTACRRGMDGFTRHNFRWKAISYFNFVTMLFSTFHLKFIVVLYSVSLEQVEMVFTKFFP